MPVSPRSDHDMIVHKITSDIKRFADGIFTRRQWPIRTHLAMYGLGTIVPVLAITTHLLLQTATLQRRQALHQAEALARQISDRVDRVLERAIAVGQTLATSRVLLRGDYLEFDEQTRRVAQSVGAIIALRDTSGQQLTNTSSPPGAPLPRSNPHVLEVDRRAAASKKPVISDLVVGTVINRPLVLATIPVIKDAEVIGFINVALYPEALSRLMAQDISEGWIVGLLGSDGRRIARTKDHERFIGTTNPRFLAAATSREGTWTGQTDEGIAISGAYVRSPLSNWTVSIGVPEELLSAPLSRALRSLVGLALGALALSLGLGWWLSRYISEPIKRLSQAAKVLGAGEMPSRAAFPIEELAEVSEGLRQSAFELARRAAENTRITQAVRESEARYRSALIVGRMASWETNFATGQRIWSPEGQSLFGISLPDGIGCIGGPRDEFRNALHPDDRHLVAHFHATARSQDSFAAEYRIKHASGEVLWVAGRGAVVERDSNGNPLKMINVVADITARKTAEQHGQFLIGELAHRSKNLLTVVQAIASQTARGSQSLQDFDQVFRDRLKAMAVSQDVVVQQSWKSASLRNLVTQQLASFMDTNNPRVSISGPDVAITVEAAQGVGLALHELATNAAKYGALSCPEGKISISWSFSEDSDRGPIMTWVEMDGPPVAEPLRQGFGHQVIGQLAAMAVGGTVDVDYAPAGLRWTLQMSSVAVVRNGGLIA